MTREKPLLAGNIRYFRLPEVLQLVALQRLTGRLTLSHGGRTVDIYLRGGRVVFASGEERASREQLGHLLVKMGRLTQAALGNALDAAAQKNERLGMFLVQEGLAAPADISSALLKQTERSVYRAMAWGEGSFRFSLCALPDVVEDFPVALRVEELILEGVRRIGEGRVISEKIPNLDVVFTKPIYSEQELLDMGLREDERLALERIDGRKDVRAILAECGLGEFTLMKALYALYSAGIIKKLDPALRSLRTQYL
ncbi:MAG TPA: DUF4388 domain-containing protein [Nitrospirota bacterium]|nr:DUF4388 domain-containing protein [Nitrospirota bacterium]